MQFVEILSTIKTLRQISNSPPYVAFKASHKEVEIYPQLNVNPPMTYIFPQLKASHKKG